MGPLRRASSGIGQKKTFGHIAVAFTMLVWGSTFAATKHLVALGISPLEILIARFALAWLLMQFIPSKKLGFTNWHEEKYFIFTGLGGVTIYFLFENTALYFTYASNVGLITGINPLMTAGLFWILFKERPSKWFFVGSVLAVFGVACVATNGAGLKVNLIGDALALGACFSWAGYTVAFRKIRMLSRQMDEISITRRIFFWGTLASLVLVPISLPLSSTFDFLSLGTPWQVWLQPGVIVPLLFLTVIASCLCYVAMNFSMRVIGEIAASTYIFTLPAISVLAAFAFLGEAITPYALVGMVAVTVGLLVAQEVWKRRSG